MPNQSNADKNRTFALPTTIKFDGITIPNPSEKHIRAIKINSKTNQIEKITVVLWQGQDLNSYSTSWEKFFIIPYLENNKVTPIVDEKLYIIGYISRERGDRVWIDKNLAFGEWEKAIDSDNPAIFAPHVPHEHLPTRQHFSSDDKFTIMFDIEGNILSILKHEAYNIEDSFLQLDDLIAIITGSYAIKTMIIHGLFSKRTVKGILGFFLKKSNKELVSKAVEQAELRVVKAIRATHAEFASLTDKEILAIRAYTGEQWAAINASLRGATAASNATNELVRNIISGLKKLPGFKGQLFRSESLAIREAATRYTPGKIFTQKGMYSTSKAGAVAQREGNIAITIKAAGKQGKDISKLAVHAGKEWEVLFPPGSRFLVERSTRVGDALIVELKELP